MGQNPVNPSPDQSGYPQSVPSGPPNPGYGGPGGPGYGYQSPTEPPVTAPWPGAASPQSAPASPPQPGPAQTVPFPTTAPQPPQAYMGQPPNPQGPYAAQPQNPYGGQNPYGAQPPNLQGPGGQQSPYGGQPQGGQPGPYGAPPQVPYGAAGGGVPAGAGAPPAPPKPAKSRKGLVIGLVAGGLVLLLIIGAGIIVSRLGGAATTSTAPDKVAKSQLAVQGYLEAVAAGDADKAKLYALAPPEDSPFLANAFLAATVAKNPITEISVQPGSNAGPTDLVSATYKIGPTAVTETFELTKVDTGWKLNTVATTIKRPTGWATLPVTLNGTAVPATGMTLFPGVYTLDSGSKLVELPLTTFTVEAPGAYLASVSTSTPQLSAAGKQLMITKSQEWLTHCLAEQSMEPKDCGMDTPMPAGATLAAGTVKRTVTTPNPFEGATPTLSYKDPMKISLYTVISISITVKDTAGNGYKGTTGVSEATGTISGDTITVVFEA